MNGIKVLVIAALAVGCASARPIETSAWTLSWTDNTGGAGSTQIDRRVGAGAFALLVTVAPGVVRYVDTTLSPGTVHCYRALAIVGSARSGYSTEVCDTAPALSGKKITIDLSTPAEASPRLTSISCSPEGACVTTVELGPAITIVVNHPLSLER